MRAALLLAILPGCFLLDASWKVRGPTTPEDLQDGWEIAAPADVGLDPAELAHIHDELLREDANFATLGFLVVKDGKLVFETYLRDPADRDRVHHLQSTTKSVTSLVFGAARDRGFVPPLDTTLCSILKDACEGLEPKKRDITLEHLLTMRSGIDFENDVFALQMLVDDPADPLRYILEKPLFASPGAKFRYRDADPQLLAFALQELTGRDEESLAEEYLFQPLGITEHRWLRQPESMVTGAYGLYLRPRDLARIGRLALQDCTWNGAEVISSEWCETAHTEHVDPERDDLGYGYQWWIVREEDAYSTWGHGGQFALVVPAANLVVVQIAQPDGALHGSRLPELVQLARPLWR